MEGTRCELLPVVCRDKPERSGGCQGEVWLCSRQGWASQALTWTLPGTRWPDRATGRGLGKAWEWFGKEGLTKPLKVTVRAVLSFLGLLQRLFTPSADSPVFQRRTHCLGCLHMPVSNWGKNTKKYKLLEGRSVRVLPYFQPLVILVLALFSFK